MVGVWAKRGISLVMITMVFLLKTISSSAHTAAAVYNKSNNNDTACCLIADELESEFLMDSEVRRMLGAQISLGTLRDDKPAAECGRGMVQTYASCLPRKNGDQPPDEHCDDPYNTRNRACRPQPT